MMKNFILIIALAVVLTSCFDDPGTDVLFDETFVELDAAGNSVQSQTKTYLRSNDGSTFPIGTDILLGSRALSNAVNVNFTVDPTSTAVEGLHYTLNSSSVTIAAGEFSAPVDITVLPDNIEAGEQLRLILKLTSADVDINPALDSAGIIMQISCPPNIPEGGTWSGETQLGVFGVTGTNTNITITPVAGSSTVYDISDVTARYYDNFNGSPMVDNPGRIENVCDAITLSATPISGFGTSVSTDGGSGAPAGTWDPTTEVFSIPWYDPGNDFAEVTEITRN